MGALWLADGCEVVWRAPAPGPGIPRSHRCARSRPFRVAKGAFVGAVLGFLVVFDLILGSRVRGNDGGCRGVKGVVAG